MFLGQEKRDRKYAQGEEFYHQNYMVFQESMYGQEWLSGGPKITVVAYWFLVLQDLRSSAFSDHNIESQTTPKHQLQCPPKYPFLYSLSRTPFCTIVAPWPCPINLLCSFLFEKWSSFPKIIQLLKINIWIFKPWWLKAQGSVEGGKVFQG